MHELVKVNNVHEPLQPVAADANELIRARQLFHNKKSNSDFKYFADKVVDYFTQWFMRLEKRCCYCGIEEHKLRELFETGRLSTKRKRGRSLELERLDSKYNLYTEDNCSLACYFCNNHKSDIISHQKHRKYFAGSISAYVNDLYGQRQKVTDSSTNYLYLSDCLPDMYPSFYQGFCAALRQEEVEFSFLEGTKDVWAVDFMPIQVNKTLFVQFTYSPDYLRKYKSHQKTITDTASVCKRLGISPVVTDIVLDGGNIVRSKSKVILTSKIFKENPQYKPFDLVSEIERLLELQAVIVPVEPKDWIGHSDGMVRFVNEHTVLINNYSSESSLYYTELKMSLRNAGLELAEIPYNPYHNTTEKDATGVYINYLQMAEKIFLPVFNMPEDEQAIRLLENLFKGQKIVPVESNEVAKEGGVLNCITWNIQL